MAKPKGEFALIVDPAVMNELERTKEEVDMIKSLAFDLSDFSQQRTGLARKAFTLDPTKQLNFDGLYIRRDGLIPNFVSKQLSVNAPLVASILNIRSSQASRFGYPQVNRHDIGYRLAFRNNEIENSLSHQEKLELQVRMRKVRDLLYTCGDNEGVPFSERLSLPQFLKESSRYALLFGMCATEKIKDGMGKFKGFRPMDAGTIFKAVTEQQDNQSLQKLRQTAIMDLRRMAGAGQQIRTEKFVDADDFIKRKFAWVQVINAIPRSAFTDEDVLVRYFYSASDIETNGYPTPPLDTIIKDVASHIHILSNSAAYFANGRATKGFLKLKGANNSEHILQRIRMQFNASINSVSNAFRMPVFGVPEDGDIEWQPFDQGSKDQEFQYLADNNARAIMSGFSITPEEIPGYGHLSKPTTTQALSESNNSYSLQVGREAGLIPLVSELEAMMNDIVKDIDPQVHNYCVFKFVGLDGEDPTKESARLQSESNLHLSANQMMRTVGKEPLPVGGNFPLNPQLNNLLKQQLPQNIINYAFTGEKSFLTDPTLFYTADGFWFQFIAQYPELLKSRGRVQKALQDNLDELKNLLYNKDKA